MWIYEKRLEYPVRITRPDPRMAKLLMAQYGGPDSEVCANKETSRQGLSRFSRYRPLCFDSVSNNHRPVSV